MNQHPTQPPATIRLLFELDFADNPRLYDDLIRFKKGTKRINRLRFLAHEGLVAQLTASCVRAPSAPNTVPVAGGAAEQPGNPSFASTIVSGVFDEPIVDR